MILLKHTTDIKRSTEQQKNILMSLFRVTSKYKAIAMLKRKQQLCPKLFAHWQAGFNV
jgi:hypothetical protein